MSRFGQLVLLNAPGVQFGQDSAACVLFNALSHGKMGQVALGLGLICPQEPRFDPLWLKCGNNVCWGDRREENGSGNPAETQRLEAEKENYHVSVRAASSGEHKWGLPRTRIDLFWIIVYSSDPYPMKINWCK